MRQDLATRFRGIVASEVQGLARQVLAEVFATYTPGDDARIPPCLVGRDCSEADEAASVATFLYELPDARLRTEAWARQLTELNPTGLMRERVYLVAEEVALLEHAARLKQSRNALIALVLGGAGTSLGPEAFPKFLRWGAGAAALCLPRSCKAPRHTAATPRHCCRVPGLPAVAVPGESFSS